MPRRPRILLAEYPLHIVQHGISLYGISAEGATQLNLADTTSATTLGMRFSAPEGGGEVNRYIAFAGNQGEPLAGESLGDHLYGGAGDGQIDMHAY